MAGELRFEQLDELDDVALRVFLEPVDGCTRPATLGRACSCLPTMAGRVRELLPGSALSEFEAALSSARRQEMTRARSSVIGCLFWPLVYWTRPREYEELIAGEHIHDELLETLNLDRRTIADIGAGTGRFTLSAARRALHVVAIDVAVPLLELLEAEVRHQRLDNVEVRRGGFRALPLDDASVDMAVACSAFTVRGPHGGEGALLEAERVVKPGGEVVVIWPQDAGWFQARGYEYRRFEGNETVHFHDVDRAAYLCGRYYSAEAEAWVREHNTADVPYAVLGVKPPNDMCIKRIER